MPPSPPVFSNTPPLPRVPFVPDGLLRHHHVYFQIDPRFRRAARLLQALWLKDHGIPNGHHVRGSGDDAVATPLHSRLSSDAASAGLNFPLPRHLRPCSPRTAFARGRLRHRRGSAAR
ncbi:hypothetical protein [Bradyrhizobium japonicum]|uniref:hypothetical protein n=1 Tax=Bradyrhizobium japonicum TaxID=375 RepID=UPI003D318103